ncbi:hypothetical protein BJ508DRAFT_336831 [Ascobolus immersus RN42]|uniref:Uncharacterized protein n=1 Tax=Ascobolus immersus RN42 TaxID=1160509 RepID=A0A3N4H766_ASCIM|nr:hypothetical protein BJ508DRAFT_336831 [Ascobolus immersus RN42]
MDEVVIVVVCGGLGGGLVGGLVGGIMEEIPISRSPLQITVNPDTCIFKVPRCRRLVTPIDMTLDEFAFLSTSRFEELILKARQNNNNNDRQRHSLEASWKELGRSFHDHLITVTPIDMTLCNLLSIFIESRAPSLPNFATATRYQARHGLELSNKQYFKSFLVNKLIIILRLSIKAALPLSPTFVNQLIIILRLSIKAALPRSPTFVNQLIIILRLSIKAALPRSPT